METRYKSNERNAIQYKEKRKKEAQLNKDKSYLLYQEYLIIITEKEIEYDFQSFTANEG